MMTHLRPPAQTVFQSVGKESSMGILDKVAEIAGAVAAVEAEKKMHPEASLLAESVAAVVGYKGGGALAELAEEKLGGTPAADNADPQA
ncbi:hypothetical protein [Paraburkholderia unamae]|uniref:hypothetical protein n=1 Tax=Paraburkholderia unamae TaxID=219649 RepID=UPI0021AC071B|nr:hypothetical protein [Paraburkholderia unamae]